MSPLFRLPRGGGEQAAADFEELRKRVRAAENPFTLRKEAYALQRRLEIALQRGDHTVSYPLVRASFMSFQIEYNACQWMMATTASMCFTSAIAGIGVQCDQLGVPFPQDLLPLMQMMAERALYAAHHAEIPLAGCIEVISATHVGQMGYRGMFAARVA